IGLGKALRLRAADLRFAAVPTTYSGSEMTNIHGTTHAGEKKTGRDDRVRPDVVVYDPRLTAGLPVKLTIQSLMNALAHVLSVLASRPVGPAAALPVAASLARAMEDLLLWPTAEPAREAAQRAASAAGTLIDQGKLGAQQAWAHTLGGLTGIDH